jgi:glycosyltransferase involved in cell wall biosynthesis
MVSVIITTYGANAKLIRAIESVLSQTYSDLEAIVVDDNNPDTEERKATESMMRKYEEDPRVRYIKHSENKNGAVARNTGIGIARGKYVAFLDDDDFFLREKIAKSVKKLEENQELVGLCQEVARINNDRLVDVMQVHEGHILTTEDILISREGIGSGSNIFVTKDIVDSIGGFDVRFRRKQDIEFIMRVVEVGSVAFQHDVQIIKDVSGVRRLSYENNRNALQQFIRKFDKEISNLSEEKQRQYYVTQYTFLYNVAKLTGDQSRILNAAKELEQYDSSARQKVKTAAQTAIKYKIMSLSDIPICQKIILLLKNRRYDEMKRKMLPVIGDSKCQEIKEILEIDYEHRS